MLAVIASLIFGILAGAYILVNVPGIIEAAPTRQAPQPTTTAEIVCNTPYIRVGAGCCLDQDANSICDKDETWPKTTSTTSTSTTSTLTTSTVKPNVACTTNIDCGPETEQLVCINDEIYLKQESPLCYKPGTTYARCVVKVSGISDVFGNPTPIERCSRGCTNGTCI